MGSTLDWKAEARELLHEYAARLREVLPYFQSDGERQDAERSLARIGALVDTVTVCAVCLTAACWQGAYMCDSASMADVIEKSIPELRVLGREDPSWWDIDPATGCARRR